MGGHASEARRKSLTWSCYAEQGCEPASRVTRSSGAAGAGPAGVAGEALGTTGGSIDWVAPPGAFNPAARKTGRWNPGNTEAS